MSERTKAVLFTVFYAFLFGVCCWGAQRSGLEHTGDLGTFIVAAVLTLGFTLLSATALVDEGA